MIKLVLIEKHLIDSKEEYTFFECEDKQTAIDKLKETLRENLELYKNQTLTKLELETFKPYPNPVFISCCSKTPTDNYKRFCGKTFITSDNIVILTLDEFFNQYKVFSI